MRYIQDMSDDIEDQLCARMQNYKLDDSTDITNKGIATCICEGLTQIFRL